MADSNSRHRAPSLWSNITLSLPSCNDIINFTQNVKSGNVRQVITDVSTFSQEKAYELIHSNATKDLVSAAQEASSAIASGTLVAASFTKEKTIEFAESGIPQRAAKVAAGASMVVAKGTAKVAFSAVKFTIEGLLRSGLPLYVATFLNSATKKKNKSQLAQKHIPKHILRWIKAHPKELQVAGFVLVEGILVWGPALRLIGLGGVVGVVGTMAPIVQKAVGAVSGVPSALRLLSDFDIGEYSAGALKYRARGRRRK